MSEARKPGDWVTIQSDPWFARGSRGVVLDVRVKRMSVAYVSDRGVERRDVAIDSVTPGHGDVGGRGWESMQAAADGLRSEAAKDVAEYGVRTGILTRETATRLVEDSRTSSGSRRQQRTGPRSWQTASC